jgi:glycosyltransferase involved in cell wall biosynthesis
MAGHASTPLFSVIIPTYDRLELLTKAIESVTKQSFSDFEVIVVDDGSTDGTQQWLSENEPRLRGVRQSNKGPGSARNAGAQIANGKYLAFFDSDDLWFPWTLEIFSRAIETSGAPGIVAGRWVEFVDETELLQVAEEDYTARVFDDFLGSSRESLAIGSGTFVVKSVAFQAVAFLEERLNLEDHDLMLQLGTHPGFVQITSPATVAWRRHRSSETANLERSVRGAARLVAREKAGAYPGGRARAKQRHEILTRHVRPVALECLRRGLRREAWNLYTTTFLWNLSLRRLRYLIGFPLNAFRELSRRGFVG